MLIRMIAPSTVLVVESDAAIAIAVIKVVAAITALVHVDMVKFAGRANLQG